MQSADAFQSKRKSLYVSILASEKQGLMCCNVKGKISTRSAGKMEDFHVFRSPAIRCLTQLIVVTKVQDVNLSEKRSVTKLI